MQLVQAWDNAGTAPEGWASHVIVNWRDFEPSAGVYRLDCFVSAIERRERPCYVELVFSLFDKASGVPIDYTPKQYKHSVKLTVNGLIGEVPAYDAAWTEAYCRAVEALAKGLRDQPQVVGYWHAAGWNGETQVAVGTRTGNWAVAARPLIKQDDYYRFITVSTGRAVAAWGAVPVYLPGTTSPGGVWGTKRRDIVADCLKAGAGYLNCGLGSDQSTAFGIGERAGLGMYDIAANTPRRGFEEGPRQSLGEPLELYWMLLHALHWQADFVNLFHSISAPQVPAIRDLLPAADARWIVFRGAEYPANTYISGGLVYGHSGEPGNWCSGIGADGIQAVRSSQRFDFDRWVLDVSGLLVLTLPGAVDGTYRVTIWRPDGSRETADYVIAGERLVLPAGRYHRVDVSARVLTIDERLAALEQRVQVLEATRRAV